MTDKPKVGDDINKIKPSDVASGELNSAAPPKVGYGSPPHHSRFKPGTSGNPYGRTKTYLTADEIFLAGAETVVRVQENGRVKKMTKERLIYLLIVREAGKGGFKAIKDLFKMMDRFEQQYGWGNVGWNMVPFWERMNVKKDIELMMRDNSDEVELRQRH